MTGPSVIIGQSGRTSLHVVLVDPLELGRDCDGILLADERVSRRHVQLEVSEGRVLATDLGSTNGTFLDGERIEAPVVLSPGSTLRLGDTTVELTPVDDNPTAEVGRRRSMTIATDRADLLRTTDPVRPTPSSSNVRRTSIEEVAAVFQTEQVRLPASAADDTVTIMFSDIESSTELALSMGDQDWYRVLTEHNDLIEARVAANGGTVIKNQGDGYMLTFSSARRAVVCASEVQRGLADRTRRDPSRAVRVRIGLHTGEAIRQDSGDLFGRHVIIAARVANLANGAEILVSSIVKEITAARGDLFFGEPRSVELKGVDGMHLVYPVRWQGAV